MPSSKVFEDNIFPRHVSDLMNLMHMIVFNGSDGEEKWTTYLTLEQKECVALALAQYYQCAHCIEHHTKAVRRAGKVKAEVLSKNMSSIVLFLRTDTGRISEAERTRWVQAWQEFSTKIAVERGDQATPHLIGLGIGMARDDDFLIQFCGTEVKRILGAQNINAAAAIGELEAVVVFMKAAASKNRVAHKLKTLLET
jgi:AhpD family alkylhydroperoxidase